MDILDLKKELELAGLVVDVDTIQSLVLELRSAILQNKIKRSTFPNTGNFPIKHVFEFLRNKENETSYFTLWNKFAARYPQVEVFKTYASYCKTPIPKTKNPRIASLTFSGVIFLVFVYRRDRDRANFDGKLSELDTVLPVDPRIDTTCDRVYVLKDSVRKVLKIGITNNLDTRIQSHQSSNPFLESFAFFAVKSRDREQQLHQLLKDYRISGTREWYDDSPEVRRLIFDYFISD